MLRSITLTNWRSHGHTRLSLTRGANLLLGPMGSGKSSLMDALCFALYGTYPKLGRREVKTGEVANFRHPGQTVAVEVEWDDGDGAAGRGRDAAGTVEGAGGAVHSYKVRRELTSSEAWLYADGKLAQKGPRAVTDEVERVLAIPYELFARAVYSEQNRLDAWLTLAPGARKAELDRLLGLDRFEAARTAATAAHNQAKERAAQAEADAPVAKLEEEKKRLQELREQAGKRAQELEAKKADEARLKKEVDAVQAEWERLESARRRKEELAQRMQKAEGTITGGERMLASLPALPSEEEAKATLERLRAGKKELELKIRENSARSGEESRKAGRLGEQIRGEQGRAKKMAELSGRQKELVAPYTSLESLRTALAKSQTGLASRQQEAAGLEASLRDAQKVLQTLEVGAKEMAGAPQAHDHSSSCPVCGTPLQEGKRAQLKAEWEGRVKELGARIREAAGLIAQERKEVERLSKQDADASRIEAQRSALTDVLDLGILQKQLEESAAAGRALEAGGKDLSTRLQELAAAESRAVGELAQIRQAAEWKKSLEGARKEKERARQEMEGLAFDEKAWSAQARKRDEVLGVRSRIGEELKGLERLAAQDAQMEKMQLQALALVEKKRADAQAARSEMDELGAFRNVLASTQAALRERLLGDLNLALTRLWPLLYPYGDWEKVRLVASEKDYAVEIYQSEWKSLEAHASGGERACLGLALRVALSVLLTPQLGWLILDEPTHNLDSRAVQTLGTALAERIPQIVPQVMVITHENQLVESTPGRVIRFSRDKLKGEDTQVEVEGEEKEGIK
ncbi:DNA double-strand break repair Rad50 ATPase [uncultured archaeon]|nr:DNA double-strand break repair Rad50 ATPase [uncultured archaeon]